MSRPYSGRTKDPGMPPCGTLGTAAGPRRSHALDQRCLMRLARTTWGLVVGCLFAAAIILMLANGAAPTHERASSAAPAPALPHYAVGDKLPLLQLTDDQARVFGERIEQITGHSCGRGFPIDSWMSPEGVVIRVQCSGSKATTMSRELTKWDLLYPPGAVGPIIMQVF